MNIDISENAFVKRKLNDKYIMVDYSTRKE